MARLTIFLLTLFAALLLVARASDSGREQQEESRCERQVERLNLRHCERHIIQRIQQQEGDEDEDDEENHVPKMRNILRSGNLKERCCNQLRELEEESPRCMCEALQQIMENQREELERSQIQEAKRELRNLPNRCNLQAPRHCDLSEQDN